MAIQAQRFFGDRESLMRKGSASARQKEFRDQTMQAAQLDEQRRQEAQRRMDLQQAYLREDLKELHGFDIGMAGGGELSNGLNMLAQDASRRMREANNPIEAQEILAGFKSQYNAMKQRNEMAKETIDQYNNAFNGSNLPKANGQQAVQPEASQVMEARNAWNNPFQGAEMQVVNGQLMIQGEDGQMISVTEDPRFINTDMWNLEMRPIDSGNLDDWAKSTEVLSNIALDFPVYDDANREAIQQRAGEIYDEGLMLQNDTGYAHRDQILNYLESQLGGANVLSAEDRQRWLNGDIRNENGEIDSAFVPIINAGKKAFQERATWTGQFSAGKSGGGSKSGGAKTGGAREGYTGATSTRVVRNTPTGPVQGEVQSLEQEGPEEITINGIDPVDMSGVLEGGTQITITGWGVDHNGELTITTEQKIGLMEVKDPDTGEVVSYRPAGPNENPDIETTKSVDISGSERASLTEEEKVILESADETLQNLGYGEDITLQTTQARSNWDASQRAAQQAANDAALIEEEVNRVTTVDDGTGQNVDPEATTYGDLETRPTSEIQAEQAERDTQRAEERFDNAQSALDELDEGFRPTEYPIEITRGNEVAETWLRNQPYPINSVYGISEEDMADWWGRFPSIEELNGPTMHPGFADAILAGLARRGVLAPEGDPRRDVVRLRFPEDFRIGVEAEARNVENQERGRQAQADMERAANTPSDGRGYPANTAPAPVQTEEPEEVPQQSTEERGLQEPLSLGQLEQNLNDWERELRETGSNTGLAVLTKNVGNLRSTSNPFQSGTVSTGSGEYAYFDNYEDGLMGLIFDVKSKQHKDGLKSRVVSPGASVLEALKIYAPAQDKNDPESYAQFIVDNINERTGSNFNVEDDFSSLPTGLLVEFIVRKEDAGLYKELKERGFFDEDDVLAAVESVKRTRV